MKIIIEIIKTRKKSFLAILALVLANVILRIFIASSQEPKLELLQKEWLEKRELPYIGTVDRGFVYDQGKKDLAAFNSRIPPKKDFARIVGDILEITSNNGLSIGSIGYKPTLIKDRSLLVYTLGFAVTGRYAAIKSFISDIERSPDILSIDSLSLSRDDLSQDSVKFSIQVSAFFRTENP
jgi:type IV pilus assembly protein PilO